MEDDSFEISTARLEPHDRPQCPICFGEFMTGKDNLDAASSSADPLTRLHCGHAFHAGCIGAWVNRCANEGAPVATCPICRTGLRDDEMPASWRAVQRQRSTAECPLWLAAVSVPPHTYPWGMSGNDIVHHVVDFPFFSSDRTATFGAGQWTQEPEQGDDRSRSVASFFDDRYERVRATIGPMTCFGLFLWFMIWWSYRDDEP